MALNISGLNELRERLERMRPEEVMARALAEQAARMAARVRDGLSEPPGGGGHDEPWLRSGALRDSVGASPKREAFAAGARRWPGRWRRRSGATARTPTAWMLT